MLHDAPPTMTPTPDQPEPRPTTALLGEAWRTNWANVTPFLPATLGLIGVGIVTTAIAMVLVFTLKLPQQPADYTTEQWFAVRGATSMVIIFLMYPVMAGLFGIAFKVLERSAYPLQGFSAAFKHYATAGTYGILITFFAVAVEYFSRSLDPIPAAIVNSLAGGVLQLPFMFVLPAAVRLDLGFGGAVKYSFRRIFTSPHSYVGYYIAAMFMSMVGIVACFVGIIVTLPIYYLAMALLFPGVGEAAYRNTVTNYPRQPGQV